MADRIASAALAKLAAQGTAAVCARADLSPETLRRFSRGMSPQALLATTVRDGHRADAIRFLAHALPQREGIWWACVVAGTAPLARAEALCLDQVEDWVYEPGEAARRRCSAAAETLAFKGAAAYAALAAAWSGGSIAPEGMPEVPPGPRLAAVGVVASLLLAMSAGDPSLGEDRFLAILSRGLDIAEGGNGRRAGDEPRRRAEDAA